MQELTSYENQISPVAEQASTLSIVDDTSLKLGVELLSRLNQFNDNITEEKEKVTTPLNQALKAERSRWKPLETLYNDAISTIRSKMVTYQTALVKAQQEAHTKLASKVSSGYMKPETAVNKIENLPAVEKEHATDAGIVQFREKKQLKIVDATQIPIEYRMIDENAILDAFKRGLSVPGCEIEIIQVPVNYR
jgi:hypothetical protein